MSAAAAVKYEQLLKRSGSTRTRRHPGRVRVSTPRHVTSGRRRRSATCKSPEIREVGRPPKIRYLEIARSLRNTISPKRLAARKIPAGSETSRLHSELSQQFIISKFIPVSPFSHLFADFRDIIARFRANPPPPPISNYPSLISDFPVIPNS